MSAAEQLPPSVSVRLDQTLQDYWNARILQQRGDSYAGVPMKKFPEDLRVYEHLLWAMAPDAVIELGVWNGGSALWFRDRLRALQAYGRVRDPRVIAVELDLTLAREQLAAADPEHEGITLLEADITAEDLPGRVAEIVGPDARCLVVEDTAHVYDTTAAALRGFARFVPVDGFFVVEDGCVDIDAMRLPEWPRGVIPAIRDWLVTEEGRRFRVRRDLELYGMSCHPHGFLERVA